MFVKFRRRKQKIQRGDIRVSSKGEYIDPAHYNKEKLIALAVTHKNIIIVPRYVLICELVESYRNENKQPRQRTIAYLAAIEEKEIKNPLKRDLYWLKIDNILKRLNLNQTDEAKIRQSINEQVPRPSEKEVMEKINEHKSHL
jgi:hypothetical protein